MALAAQIAAPRASKSWKRQRGARSAPARVGATVENPGTNLQNSSERNPKRSYSRSIPRTQESGETAILHTVFRIRRPCQPPRLNQNESASVAPATAAPSRPQGESLPSAASAPATTITGTAGIGSPEIG